MPCEPYIPQTLPARVSWRVTRSTAQSIPNVTVTVVTWPTEVFDSHAYFTPGGSLATVPAGKAGLYLITARVDYASTPAGINLIRVTAGGVTYDSSGTMIAGIRAISFALPLAVADTVQVSVYQANGGALDIASGTFEGYLVGL